MKKFLSLFLVLTMVISLLPTTVGAVHQHSYEQPIDVSKHHPHDGLFECYCGEVFTAEYSYSPDCPECMEEICFEHDAHFFLYNITDVKNGWYECQCYCGETVCCKDEIDDFLESEEERFEEFCMFLNETTISYVNPRTDDFNDMFSKKAKATHPHSGYFTNSYGEDVYLERSYDYRCKYCIEELCTEHDKHSFLFDCSQYDTYIKAYCFCGDTMKISNNRINDFLEERKTSSKRICNNLNIRLADECGSNRVIYADEEVKDIAQSAESTINMEFNAPSVLTEASGFTITGVATSNYNITMIEFSIKNTSGSTIHSSKIEPQATYITIENTSLNNNLPFSSLSAGSYILYACLEDTSGTFADTQVEFTVEEYPDNSTLTINGDSLPLTIPQGNSFGLRGSIVSNYTITDVYGKIVDSNGNTIMNTYDNPKSTYMDIKNANLNWNMVFGKLKSGNYTLFIEAYDESGAYVVLDNAFSVVSSGNSTSSPKGNNNTPSTWDGIVYENNFTPKCMDVKNNDAELNDTAYDAGKTLRTPAKGETLYLTGRCTNKYGNTWYICNVSGKQAFIWSGDLKEHTHKYDKLTIASSTYKVCDCGDVKTSNGNVQMSSMAISAAAMVAVDGPLPIGDLAACAVTLGALYMSAVGTLPTVNYLATAISDVDFDNYLKKRSENICSEYSFRKVQRFKGGLKYIDKYCMDPAEAYIYLTAIGGDVYTESEDSAMMLVAQLHGSGICERDKDKESYFYHYHLGTDRAIGGHIFFGTNDFGDMPH